MKRNEYQVRFDEECTKLNDTWRQFSINALETFKGIDYEENSRRRGLIGVVRNIQSMLQEGVEKYNSGHDMDALLKSRQEVFLKIELRKLPLTWVASPPRELSYQEVIEAHAKSHYSGFKVPSSDPLKEYRDLMNYLDVIKIDLFINSILDPQALPAELSLLEETLFMHEQQDLHACYLLAYLNQRLTTGGVLQLKIGEREFVKLKNVFLNILSSRCA